MKRIIALAMCFAMIASGMTFAEELAGLEGYWHGYAVRVEGEVYAIGDMGLDIGISIVDGKVCLMSDSLSLNYAIVTILSRHASRHSPSATRRAFCLG